jgi:hypothetical protein
MLPRSPAQAKSKVQQHPFTVAYVVSSSCPWHNKIAHRHTLKQTLIFSCSSSHERWKVIVASGRYRSNAFEITPRDKLNDWIYQPYGIEFRYSLFDFEENETHETKAIATWRSNGEYEPMSVAECELSV